MLSCMNTRLWLHYFIDNEHRPDAIVPDVLDVPAALRAPLIDALRTFQAGETGEGRIVRQAARVAGSDVDFAATMRLYIAEEGRHARELGLLVRALGGTPVRTVPAAVAFRFARRLAGFEAKMAVLTAAEIVGIVFYDLLAERVPCPELCAVVARISREERFHLAYQRDYFARFGWPRVTDAAVQAVTFASIAAFAVDQRALLAALGVGPRDLLARVRAVLETVRASTARRPVDALRSPTARSARARSATALGGAVGGVVELGGALHLAQRVELLVAS